MKIWNNYLKKTGIRAPSPAEVCEIAALAMNVAFKSNYLNRRIEMAQLDAVANTTVVV